MSKRRPNKVYEVLNGRGEKVVVLARHQKGARSVAGEYLRGVTPKSPVAELPGVFRDKARNRTSDRTSDRKGA